MSRAEEHGSDAFLAEVRALDDALDVLEDVPGELTPPPGLRDAILAAASPVGRFERFADRLAAMLDVTRERAVSLLDAIPDLPWQPAHLPGSATCWVDGGPATDGAIRGFVRYPAATPFPEHRHLGRETVLFLSGGATMSDGAECRPGDVHVMPAGSRHSFETHPGPDLLYFVVVFDGVDMGGGMVLKPES